jgi:hypothetical protein
MDDGKQLADQAQKVRDCGAPAAASGALRPAPSAIRHPFSDLAIASACGVFVALMVGMSYAAVPLYSWFCRTTGFGGVPQVVTAAPGSRGGSRRSGPRSMCGSAKS